MNEDVIHVNWPDENHIVDKTETAILALLKDQFNSLSLEEKTPYDYIMKEAKERLKQHQEAKPEDPKQSKKRCAREFYCDENLPELKKRHAGWSYSELVKKLQAEWKKLTPEEKEEWKEKAMIQPGQHENEDGDKSTLTLPWLPDVMKLVRAQRHPTRLMTQLTNFELKAKKASMLGFWCTLVSGKDEEDPWKERSKEEKWVFYDVVERDIKRYKEDVSLAEEGLNSYSLIKNRKADLLQRKKQVSKVLMNNKFINNYIFLAVRELINNQISRSCGWNWIVVNENEGWSQADETCRAIAYLTMCHRIDRTEQKCNELLLADTVDLMDELKKMDEECNAFCKYLIANKEIAGNWKENKRLYTKWNSLSMQKKMEYFCCVC